MESDPVARALISAAGVGIFPYQGEPVYRSVDVVLRFRGYTRNLDLLSKITTLIWMVGNAAIVGGRQRMDPTPILQQLERAWLDISNSIHGENKQASIIQKSPEELYKEVFGDVDMEQLSKQVAEWNKSRE